MIGSDILFTGYYGQLNTGDDAFVEVASWGAKNIWYKNKLRFTAVNQRLPKVQTSIKGYPLTLPKTYNFQQELLLSNTYYLISAGGSTFQNEIRIGSLKAKAMRLQEKNKLKIGAIGVSVGPFKNKAEERTNIEYLKRMSFLALRDKRSYDYVQTLDLPYKPIEAFDLAALLPDIYQYDLSSRRAKKEKVIGVSVCNYERYTNGDTVNEERRNAAIVSLLKELDNRVNVTFHFFVINGSPNRGDAALTKETVTKVAFKNKVEIIDYNPNVRTVWEGIANCDFVLTTRLHAGIFACFANTPFMLVEYHQKCKDFLGDVGQPSCYRLDDARFEPENVIGSIQKLLEEETWNLPLNRQAMIDKAYLNFKNISL